jgi:hypothetical protein
MSNEMDGAFDGIDKALNTKFEKKEDSGDGIVKLQDEIQEIEDKKDKIKTGLIEIEDADFLDKELKTLMVSSRSVLVKLEQELKIGSTARMYEVYAGMLNSLTAQYKELRQLNESVAKLKYDQNVKNPLSMAANNKILLSSDQLLDMIQDASNSSNMNAIEVDFEVEVEDLD